MTCRENLMMVPGGTIRGNICGTPGSGAGELPIRNGRCGRKADRGSRIPDHLEHLADQKAGPGFGRAEESFLELGPHHDGGCQDRVSGRGRRGREPHPSDDTIGDAIMRLNKERGYTFVVIEHDMDFIAKSV